MRIKAGESILFDFIYLPTFLFGFILKHRLLFPGITIDLNTLNGKGSDSPFLFKRGRAGDGVVPYLLLGRPRLPCAQRAMPG